MTDTSTESILDALNVTIHDPIELFRNYFAKRGISEQLIDQSGIQLMTFDRALDLHPRLPTLIGRNGFVAYIPFFDQQRQPVQYHVARVLQLVQTPGTFAEQMGLEIAKMACPTGAPLPYFPVNNPPPSKDVRCVITESAIKALVLANLGYYAIGLNGCWGYTAKSMSMTLLPELLEVPWKAFKDVVFLPDSDVQSNPHVSAAAARLYTTMRSLLRVDCPVITIPHDADGEKQGIDDYFTAHGADDTRALVSGQPSPPEMSEYLAAMTEINNNVSYIMNANIFAVHDENNLIKDSHFHTLYAPLTYLVNDKPKSATKAWISWEGRNAVRKLVNRPGREITDGKEFYNMWRPSGVRPIEGPVDTHLKFMERAFLDPTERHYVMCWIAHTVQKCWERKNVALVFFSEEQGTGKSMLADVVGRMVGEHNVGHVSMDVFRSPFNGSYMGKQLLILNETHSATKGAAEAVMDKLKMLITEPIGEFHAKNKDPVPIENYTNIILTTNHLNALKLEPTDRRFGVFKLASQFRASPTAERWGEECWTWHRDNTAALLYFYERYEMTGFHPGSPAIYTEAKGQMAEAGYSELELMALGLSQDVGAALEELGLSQLLEYVTPQTLLQAAFPTEQRAPRAMAVNLGRAMARFGFESVKTKVMGKTVRVYDLLRRGRHHRHINETITRDVLAASREKY